MKWCDSKECGHAWIEYVEYSLRNCKSRRDFSWWYISILVINYDQRTSVMPYFSFFPGFSVKVLQVKQLKGETCYTITQSIVESFYQGREKTSNQKAHSDECVCVLRYSAVLWVDPLTLGWSCPQRRSVFSHHLIKSTHSLTGMLRDLFPRRF